jgi:hypothetical protein
MLYFRARNEQQQKKYGILHSPLQQSIKGCQPIFMERSCYLTRVSSVQSLLGVHNFVLRSPKERVVLLRLLTIPWIPSDFDTIAACLNLTLILYFGV